MREKYFGSFKSLLYKLLLLENASAFNISENIRRKELPNTPIIDSLLILIISLKASFLNNFFQQKGFIILSVQVKTI
jgi:hypothetical protein